MIILDERNKLNRKILLGVPALLGAFFVFFLTGKYGIGLSPDSIYYISVARHVANGAGFIGYDGYSYVLQPPLYPLILGIIKWGLHADPLISAGYINGVIFGLIIYLTGILLTKHINLSWLVLFGTVIVLVSFVLIQLYLKALTEPLFILLVLLYILFIEKYRKSGNVNSLIIFSISVALACLTRYIGIILILSGVIGILLRERSVTKEKIYHAIGFVLIASVPVGVWIIRNYILSGTLVGQRAESSYTLQTNLLFLFNTVLKWFAPVQFEAKTWLLLIIAGTIFVLAVSYIIKGVKSEENNKYNDPIIIFVLLYSIFLTVSSTTTAYDRIADRLLSPVYIPAIIIVFIFLDDILFRLSKYIRKKTVVAISSALIVLWMIYPLGKTVYLVKDYIKNSGWGYSSDKWNSSETIKYLVAQKDKEMNNSVVYSNSPEVVYLFTNIIARWSPCKTMYNSPEIINNTSSIKRFWQQDSNVKLVWFNNVSHKFLFTLDELKQSTKIVKIHQFSDGEIFTVRDK